MDLASRKVARKDDGESYGQRKIHSIRLAMR